MSTRGKYIASEWPETTKSFFKRETYRPVKEGVSIEEVLEAHVPNLQGSRPIANQGAANPFWYYSWKDRIVPTSYAQILN